MVDDNPEIHTDFSKILCPDETDAAFDAAAAEFFGEAPRVNPGVRFELTFASQGKEALDRVVLACEQDRRFAVVFMDVRIPPGWDGMETTLKLWEVDPDLQIVICTAYSDYSWQEMMDAIQNPDRLLVLKKPFDTIEILQFAHALTEKWALLQASRQNADLLEAIVRTRTHELEEAKGKLEAEIAQRQLLEEHFRQSQKLEAIGTLAGGIAHDFNNILSAINGYSDLARVEAKNHPAILDYLDSVQKGARRATELVRQILTFSRQQPPERRAVQLWHVASEAVKMLRATIPATIDFHVELATDTPVVFADTTQIHQVIVNLVTNGWHAMKNYSGRLLIRLENHVEGEERSGSLRPGRYARLEISDSGCGMDETTLNRIFEPFFTTKAPGEGTGLGLAVVQGIMQSHDGCITVRSTVGKGTTFQLFFPAHIAEITEAPAEKMDLQFGDGQRILYLDDEPTLASLGVKMLHRLKYNAESYTDPEAALAAVRSNATEFDLVITDLSMPVMSGVEFAIQVRSIRPDLPVLLTTGYGAGLTEEQIRASGIQEVVLKPVSLKALASTLERSFAGSKS